MKLTEVAEVVEHNADTVFKRAPVWSLGIVLILVTGFGGIYILRDSLLAINSNAEKIKSLETQVAHCQEMRISMEHEIAYLREENGVLKQRVSTLEEQVKRHVP